MNENVIEKKINDLGMAAYIMMHGYKVLGKNGKSYLFEVDEKDVKEFDARKLEYLSSDFHRFDSCLMSLKKINEYNE